MDPEVRRHTEKAVELLRSGKLPHAAAEFEHAVRLAPGDVTLRQRLGDVYLRLGLRTHAIHEFQAVAGRYAADGQLLRSIAICKVILEIDPEHHETLHTLADLYALQHETLPMVQKLPASMSAAVSPDAPTEKELQPLDLESLAVFRDALESAVPRAPDDDDEATTVQAPRAATIDLSTLPPSPLFSALDKEAFEAVVKKLDLRWVAAGETLVREGEQGDSMFVVVQGVVHVMHGDKVLAVMSEGAFFGEMALLTDSPRLASVVAAKDGLLFEIHRTRLEEIAKAHPAVGNVIAAFYQDRLLANVLRASPVFRPLTDGERRELGVRFVRHSLPPQTVLLEQGKPGAGFCILLRGKCEVFHQVGKGEQLALPPLKEGDVFGEISLLTGSPCTATVRTHSFCEVLELPREDFQRLVLPNPEIRSMVQKLMSERLSRTADVLEREGTILPDYIV
ncbi:MAG: cyclic nucleotide-binding domain-containing protein [Myxococcales bacterium]